MKTLNDNQASDAVYVMDKLQSAKSSLWHRLDENSCFKKAEKKIDQAIAILQKEVDRYYDDIESVPLL